MLKPILFAALFSLCRAPLAAAGSDIIGQFKAGGHQGELKQLEVDIAFSGARGVTTTDARGITYNFWGSSLFEPKVYPSKYWGDFPLYFFGLPVHSEVTVTNRGPRNSFRLRVTVQAYSLNLDGSNGVRLAPDVVREFNVGRGETQRLDTTFTPQFTAGADSGLDRVVILVQHVNEGGQGKGNPYPALLLAKEAIICPPAVEAAGTQR